MKVDLQWKIFLERCGVARILRDAQRVYGRNYNLDTGFSILNQLTTALKNGEYAGLKHFKQPSRVLRKYLSAFEDIFLIHKIPAHEDAIGGDIWTFLMQEYYLILQKA